MYFAAVAPPAPPPITTTLGIAPKAIEGIESAVVDAAIMPTNERLVNLAI
jgi:hypothetical protein